MTDQQSLDDIRMLLLRYPGVTSAVVFRVPDGNEIHVRFRINDAISLRSIAATAVGSNVSIQLGDPNSQICAEPSGFSELPCDISIPDFEMDVPTYPQIFGVYISADLENRGLITTGEVNQLHKKWNTRLLSREPQD